MALGRISHGAEALLGEIWEARFSRPPSRSVLLHAVPAGLRDAVPYEGKQVVRTGYQ
jgi:hypothetical protein